MNDLAIYINAAGPNTILEKLVKTIDSYKSTLKDTGTTYKICLHTDNYDMGREVMDLYDEDLLDVYVSNRSFAINYEIFFDEYKKDFEYVMISHDDLIITTPDWFNHAKRSIGDKLVDTGWISFTSTGYRDFCKIPMSNSVREGFATDRERYPYCFECHHYNRGDKFTDDNKHLLDYPIGPVKVHAIFPHIMLISSKNMEVVGPCSDWSEYTLLIDEDWSMTALKHNLINVWVPDVFYQHPLQYPRKADGIRYQQEVHAKFAEKWEWNFNFGNYSDEFIDYFCKKFKDTNIPISQGKPTFAYQYVHELKYQY
jgi:hypothetical protein